MWYVTNYAAVYMILLLSIIICITSFEGVRIMGFGSRPMHKITCADCGKEAEVPFVPQEGRPVYCRDCYQKHRTNR